MILLVMPPISFPMEPNTVSLRTSVAFFFSAWMKSLLFLLTVELYYPLGQIQLTLSETSTLGGRCALSIAVWRWAISLTPAERSEKDNGFRLTPRGAFTWGKHFLLILFSFIYLWRADRTHMLFSAMFCFTLAWLHTFGSCRVAELLQWSSWRLLKDILTAAAKRTEIHHWFTSVVHPPWLRYCLKMWNCCVLLPANYRVSLWWIRLRVLGRMIWGMTVKVLTHQADFWCR